MAGWQVRLQQLRFQQVAITIVKTEFFNRAQQPIIFGIETIINIVLISN